MFFVISRFILKHSNCSIFDLGRIFSLYRMHQTVSDWKVSMVV